MRPHIADPSLKGKLRRRLSRLIHRRRANVRLDRPLVSICFDDAPASAAEAGDAVLKSRGVRGTYYICAGMTGHDGPMGPNASVAQIRRLLTEGHEIGCHTLSHLDCGDASTEWIDEEVTKNGWKLAEMGAPAPVSFAYPYGDVSPRAKRILGERFALSRGLHHGLITNGVDLNQAPAVGIEGPGGEATAARWLDRALRRRAWLILYTHDVSDAPTDWGCTPASLGRLVDRALEGGAEIVPVREGCRRIGALGGNPQPRGWPTAGSLSGTAGARYARG